MNSFLSTTFKLWYRVPGYPPLWKCAMVAWVVSQQEKQEYGLIGMDHMVESERDFY